MGRAISTAGAVTAPLAAAGATSTPVIWAILGYQFEAASMIAAMFGCFAARFWIGAGQQVRQQHRWILDVPVSAVTLGSTATLVMLVRPAPFYGLIYGAGLGMLGEGIFKFADQYVRRMTGMEQPPTTPAVSLEDVTHSLHQAYPSPIPAPPEDMARSMDKLK